MSPGERTERSASPLHFGVIDNSEHLDTSYILRYQAYCLEKRFLSPEDYPAGKETDSFDNKHAIHIGGLTQNDTLFGTVRLVLPSDLGLPLHDHCRFFDDYRSIGERSNPALQSFAEISRLVISKQFRQRAGDGFYAEDTTVDHGSKAIDAEQKYGHRRKRPELVIGLYKAMYQTSKRRGISHWLIAMERSLAILLSRLHLKFEQIGPEVDYYGPVAPYMAKIEDIEARLLRKQPELLWEMMEGLEPELRPALVTEMTPE